MGLTELLPKKNFLQALPITALLYTGKVTIKM